MAQTRGTFVAVCVVLMLYGLYKASGFTRDSVSGWADAANAAMLEAVGNGNAQGGADARKEASVPSTTPHPAGIPADRSDDDYSALAQVSRPSATPRASAAPSPKKNEPANSAVEGGVPIRPAFDKWMRESGCSPALQTTRRDDRFLEPVWAGEGEDAGARGDAINNLESSDDARARQYIVEHSAFTTPIPKQYRPPAKHLLVVYGGGGVPEFAKEASKLFSKAYVVGGGDRKMHIQACNDESWLRIITCVAHLVQSNVAANFTTVTLFNLGAGAPETHRHDAWACVLRELLRQSDAEYRKRDSGGLFSFSLQPTKQPVGDRCRVGVLAEDVAYWLSRDEYDQGWTPRSSALTTAFQAVAPSEDVLGDPSDYVKHYYHHRMDTRMLHVPLSMFPLFTGMANAWRLYDVTLEDAIGVFVDLMAVVARKQGVVVQGSLSFAHDGVKGAPRALGWDRGSDDEVCRSDLSEPRKVSVDDHRPRDPMNFLPVEYVRALWHYPFVHSSMLKVQHPVDVMNPEAPKQWREPRRMRTPAIFLYMKNKQFADRHHVKRYLESMQRHFRRVYIMTTHPFGMNSFVPTITAFCGCNNDLIGCMYANMRSRFFQRSGGMVFAHADSFFIPREWMGGENNMRHIIVSKEHPLTEGLDAVDGRWNKATQGPRWVYDDHHLSSVRGRRPDTGFGHLHALQVEWGAYFRPYVTHRDGFKQNLEDSAANVIFGDLAYYPASALDAGAAVSQHMFAHMIMAEPGAGWLASITSLMTGVPRDSFKYTGGCCYGNEVNHVSRSPAGHRFDLNRANIVDIVTRRFDDSFSCKESGKTVSVRHAYHEMVSSTTCAQVVTHSLSASAEHPTTIELINPFTNDITLTLISPTAAGDYDADVTVIFMTTNANTLSVKCRPDLKLRVKLRVMIATGVWQRTKVSSKVPEAKSGDKRTPAAPAPLDVDDAKAEGFVAPFVLDEDEDTFSVLYQGVLDTLTVEIDTSKITVSAVTVDGGEEVAKAGVVLKKARGRLDD
jgi:hypothetical protein